MPQFINSLFWVIARFILSAGEAKCVQERLGHQLGLHSDRWDYFLYTYCDIFQLRTKFSAAALYPYTTKQKLVLKR